MVFFIRLASGLLCWCEGFVCVFSNKSCSSELNSTTLYFQILLLVKEIFKNVTLSFYIILFLREEKQFCVNQTKPSPALSMGFSLFWTFTSKLKAWGLRSQLITGAAGPWGATRVNFVKVGGLGGLYPRLSAPRGRFPFIAIQRCSEGDGEWEDMKRGRASALWWLQACAQRARR